MQLPELACALMVDGAQGAHGHGHRHLDGLGGVEVSCVFQQQGAIGAGAGDVVGEGRQHRGLCLDDERVQLVTGSVGLHKHADGQAVADGAKGVQLDLRGREGQRQKLSEAGEPVRWRQSGGGGGGTCTGCGSAASAPPNPSPVCTTAGATHKQPTSCLSS